MLFGWTLDSGSDVAFRWCGKCFLDLAMVVRFCRKFLAKTFSHRCLSANMHASFNISVCQRDTCSHVAHAPWFSWSIARVVCWLIDESYDVHVLNWLGNSEYNWGLLSTSYNDNQSKMSGSYIHFSNLLCTTPTWMASASNSSGSNYFVAYIQRMLG